MNSAWFVLFTSSFGSPSVFPGSGGCLPLGPTGRAWNPLPKCFSSIDWITMRMEVMNRYQIEATSSNGIGL